ncbi:hypothetical protein EYE40_09195 [Glaciihabitans arcticus]|uniref:Uncharacterized protein n=1 Tax=Glaciihabitans arcticus TaxID=2668039 RepID=A0A4V6MTN7_9MICO|nr:hypothetical protein [Glaciihabitans arcticus]TBN57549.1 hypothetical protein EYE40_09195 [Glaciihabitans arcticus]
MRQLLPLRVRPATWAFVPIILIMWFGYLNFYTGPGAPYWDAAFSRPANAFWFGLPLVAAVNAAEFFRLRSGRVLRSVVITRSALRLFVAHSAPGFAIAAVGYLSLVAVEVVRGGVPSAGYPSPALLAAVLAVIVAALAFGAVLGLTMHVIFSVPLAVVLTFLWVTVPRSDGYNLGWRHMAGYGLHECCETFAYTIAWQAWLAPVLVALALALLALAFLSAGNKVVVRLGALVAGTILVAGAFVTTSGMTANSSASRPVNDLVCAGDSPIICTWPEQAGGADGAAVSDTLRTAFASAASRGIELPATVTAAIRPEEPSSGDDITYFGYTGPADTPAVIVAYADAITSSRVCGYDNLDEAGYQRLTRASYALALTMGGGPNDVLPELYVVSAADEEPELMSPEEILASLDVSPDSAAAVYTEWATAQSDCPGKKE